jgi:hypothetical protein
LQPHFPEANLLELIDKDGLRWARFDFSPMLLEATLDSKGHWLAQTKERTVEREVATDILVSTTEKAISARAGTPVHAWRELALIEADGAPTRRGVIFSFFQHGEGLAIAAALEDESYDLDELLPHLANLRSDCRYDLPDAGGSERLSAVCRATYGFVNHSGYLESGLPVGYGGGTTELLGLIESGSALPRVAFNQAQAEIADGDLNRAYIEWLSLMRHIANAPAHDWQRWTQFKTLARKVLEQHLLVSQGTLHPKFPALTPKQKHDKPRHYLMRG